ncbi:MAG: hypothetical protein E6Q97_23485 [Desulfurellales bacterium]|nr:MAG: hypothetical protein E6Q97_23485 [Desulfurellales bacterium]
MSRAASEAAVLRTEAYTTYRGCNVRTIIVRQRSGLVHEEVTLSCPRELSAIAFSTDRALQRAARSGL